MQKTGGHFPPVSWVLIGMGVLAGFAEHDVASKQGVVLVDFEASGVVPLVLLGVVDVFALGALELDDDAIALFLGHGTGAPANLDTNKAGALAR